MPLKQNMDVKQRYLSQQDAGVAALAQGDTDYLNQHIDYARDLGMIIGDNNSVPSTNGVPRIFVVGYDERNNDRIMSLGDKNIELGSEEFWKQAQLGNIFVYPAGATKPSQLQVTKNENRAPEISLSVPIDDTRLPQMNVKRPNIFKRWFSFLNKRWRDEVDRYDNLINDKDYNYQTLHSNERDRNCDEAKYEQNRAEDHLKHEEMKKISEAKMKDFNDAEAEKELVHQKEEHVDTLYQPKPVIHKDMLRTEENSYGYYRQSQFDKLTQFDIKMDKILAGPNKQPLSDKDFATVAYFTATTPENMGKTRTLRGANDPHFADSSVEAGFFKTKEEAEAVYDMFGVNFATTDLFVNSQKPRDNGGVIIEGTIDPARKQTRDAFAAYASGDNSKLAKLIAHGVNSAATDIAAMNIYGTEGRGSILMAHRLNELIQKDPSLKTEALKYGMKPENLQMVEGASKYWDIQEKGLEAKSKLAEAKAYSKDLKESEKQGYLKDIVKAEIAQKTFMDEQDKINVAPTEWYVEKSATNSQNAKGDLALKIKTQPLSRPAPEKGKVWFDSLSYLYAAKMRENPRNQSMKDLATEEGMKKLDRTAEEIIKQEKLYTNGQPAADLHEKMKTHQYDPQVLKNVGKTIKNEFSKKEPQGQPQANMQEPEVKQEGIHV